MAFATHRVFVVKTGHIVQDVYGDFITNAHDVAKISNMSVNIGRGTMVIL